MTEKFREDELMEDLSIIIDNYVRFGSDHEIDRTVKALHYLMMSSAYLIMQIHNNHEKANELADHLNKNLKIVLGNEFA